MKYHINAREYIFAFVAVSAAVAGLAVVGSLRADIESDQSPPSGLRPAGQSLHDAAKDACMQLEGQLKAIEREKEGMGCFREGSPQECEILLQKQTEVEEAVRQCYDRIKFQYENSGNAGVAIEEFVPLRVPEDRGYQEKKRDCAAIEEQIKRMKDEYVGLCAQGAYPEKCRAVEEELNRQIENLYRCTSNASPGTQGQPVPQMQWNGTQMQPMPQMQWNSNQMQPMPPVPWNEGQSVEVQTWSCGNYEQELFQGKRKAEEICTQNPGTKQCMESMSIAEEIAQKYERCMQEPPSGGWNQPQPIKMPYEQRAPQPWQDAQVRPMPYGTDGDGGYMGQPRMEMMPGMQPVPMEGGQYMQQPFPGGGQEGYGMDTMVKEQFYDIIRQARERLEEALRFVDSDMAGVIEEAIGALDELENKFAGGDVQPAREDIEKLILRLEEVKRSVQERAKQQGGLGVNAGGAMEGGPGMQRPQRNVDAIVGELSTVFEQLIPRVFEIFEEEGVIVPPEVKESFQEAFSAFESILPMCSGGEMKRRVCAAAMQEVFLILEEDMRPFVEGRMMGNERLRTRVEELSREIGGKE